MLHIAQIRLLKTVAASDRFRLDGRTALVTGAGRGIGRACAIALAQAGAEVWLIARTKDEIEQAAAEIRAAGGKAHAAVCDVLSSAAFNKVIAAMPVLDILVNNAGSNIPEPFVEVSEEHLDRILTSTCAPPSSSPRPRRRRCSKRPSAGSAAARSSTCPARWATSAPSTAPSTA